MSKEVVVFKQFFLTYSTVRFVFNNMQELCNMYVGYMVSLDAHAWPKVSFQSGFAYNITFYFRF